MTDQQASCWGPLLILAGLLHLAFAWVFAPHMHLATELLLFDQAYGTIVGIVLLLFGGMLTFG